MDIIGNNTQVIQDYEFEKKWGELLIPMTKNELISLNKMIIHRVKIMNQLHDLGTLNRLKVGDKVKWNSKFGIVQTGTIIRLNSKTASVRIGESEGYWRISPQLLEKTV